MKTTTPITVTHEDALKAKNEAVKKAYFFILSEIKELLKLFPREYHRTFTEVDYSALGFSNQHAIYSPLLHLRFQENIGECTIYFAKNNNVKSQIGRYLDTLLSRCIYKNTSVAVTEINIEDALDVNNYKFDDYKDVQVLLDKGFAGCKRVTVEAL
jgi:hypothetical protein